MSKNSPDKRCLRPSKTCSTKVESSSSSESNTSEYDSDDLDIVDKSSVLHNNTKVYGDRIFGFKSTKKGNLTRKATETLVNSAGPKSSKNDARTPYNIRQRMKKKLAATIKDSNSSSENDYSESGSEYSLSESSKSSSSEESGDDSDSSDSSEKPTSKINKSAKCEKTPNLATTKRNSRHEKYIFKTEDYFASHSSKKITTSNNTLDKLKTPRLPHDQLQKLLSNMKLSSNHKQALNILSTVNKANFLKWMYIMHENFNVLLYGLGSKKNILQQFHKEVLKDLPVIVVNGYFPSLTIKDILDSIIINILELRENPTNVYEACDLIAREFSYIPQTHLYVIVNNIEGNMLRNGKSQNVLSRLAAVQNIHLIASIDHINAPLVWDHFKLSKFNFIWWDTTSFLPYMHETSFESSMMVQRSGMLALSSLNNVFLSLTTNSKGIYLIIVKHQLANYSQHYQGLLFKDLYTTCREAFLVSSDLALRAQLTEFVDHKMVKFRRAVDGGEYLLIPISNLLLQQFLDEQK